MQSEPGHHPDRAYTDQDGDLHLNGSTLRTDESSGAVTGSELAVLDGVTPGTVSASKAVVADGNKDLTGLRNLTITGTLTGGSSSGASSIVTVPVDSATIISVGDMVWIDTDDVKPASDFSWDTDLGVTQAGFAEVFLGIALEASADAETDPIQVETDPAKLFEAFAVASGNYVVGANLGPDENPSNTLANQTLEAASSTSSIARAQTYGSSVTELDVRFASAYHPGSANNNAHLG